MNLSEIIRTNATPRDLPRTATLTRDYLERATRTRYRIGDYPVYEIEPEGRAQAKLMLFIASPDGEELLGQMALLKHPHGNETYVFSEVYFDPSVQGKGLAVPLYKLAVLKYGRTIVSDETQTPGSERLWNRLARDPDVHVYAWDTEKDTYQAFDPDEPDDVYFDRQELEQLKKEEQETNSKIQDQYMSGEIDSDEYDQLLRRYLYPIHDEIESLDRARDMRLVATKDSK